MTIEELNARIEKKNKDIEKIQKRIDKWNDNKNSEKAFRKEYSWLNSFEERYDELKENWIKECDTEIRKATRDLNENLATLKKYQEQLDKLNTFNKEDKIDVIWDFLNEWEEKAYNWYLNNAQEYFELKQKENEEYQDWKEEHSYINRYSLQNYFRKEYYRNIPDFTQSITRFKYDNHICVDYDINERELKETLSKEKEAKYQYLIARVQSIVGNIVNADYLRIGSNGEINGYIEGTDGKCSVQTISAGGYNIQCFHYRVLVHKI